MVKPTRKLMLKEVFLKEQTGQSAFLNAMRKQFGRARDQEDLDYMVNAYDRILQLVFEPDAQKRQEVLKHEEPFFKFHFMKANMDVNNGILSPESVKTMPSGKDMLNTELEKRRASQAEQEAQRKKNLAAQQPMTAKQKADAELRAVYGGDPNDPRVGRSGLGS